MSFCTSFSSKRRPIRRFTAKTVFFALVTACRLAGAPTRISPSSAYATTDGVVRAPSEFSITLGRPPSMIATQLFVVPRSMPMILLILIGLRAAEWVVWTWNWGSGILESTRRCVAAAGLRRLRYGHQGRAQDPVVEEVALLEDRHDGVGRQVAFDGLHRLMLVRIEFLAGRVDFPYLRPAERGVQRLQREIGAGLQRLGRDRLIRGERLLERVLDREQILGKFLDRVLVRAGDVELALAADVLDLGAGAQPRVLHCGGFGQRLFICVVRLAFASGTRLVAGRHAVVED